MRIIRFLSDDGRVCRGAAGPGEPVKARPIEGDLFGEYSVSDTEITVARLLPPLEPPNIYALGLNYRRHAEETGIPCPGIPLVFIKATTSVIGPGEAIVLPAAGPGEVDYEGELALVIGRAAKNVPEERAMEHVFGFTCANDVSARDWQNRLQMKQWARGKSFDTFCPIGPWIVTADEIPDPGNLRITTHINGAAFQDSSTADMIFNVPRIVSDLSRSITLLPGTLILTGTPEGVGFTRRPPVFLKAGDLVEVAVEGIGTLSNLVVNE
ncbi:MAG TPA: 5-carboxymethyl-2-hydroxymuconate isomerase [Spirochaetes bacterium]|nr:5-carboxymethyl-2-hydroxymuconate isomerase [Spirochaetota bacterium]